MVVNRLITSLETIDREVRALMNNTYSVGVTAETLLGNCPHANREVATTFWISNFLCELKNTEIKSWDAMFRATVVWELALIYSSPQNNNVSQASAALLFRYYNEIVNTLEEKMTELLSKTT